MIASGAKIPGLVVLACVLLAGCGDSEGEDGAGGGAAAGSTSSASVASSTASASTSTGAGGGPGCGPVGVVIPAAACTTCVAEACCDEQAACAAEPDCAAFLGCFDACNGDVPCLEACPLPMRYVPEILELQRCQVESCLEPCSMDEVVCALPVLTTSARDQDACDACVEEACCDVFESLDPVANVNYIICLNGCLDMTCLRDCELAWPQAAEDLSRVNECGFGDTCGASCVHPDGCGIFIFGGDAGCNDCLQESCCEVHEACGFDISCGDFFTCRQSCHDQVTCRECLDLWPVDVAGLGTAMLACGEVVCTEECGDAGTCALIPGLDSLECRGCVSESCCEASKACGADPGCATLQICVGLCDEDPDCEDACAADHPAGAALFEALDTCKLESCPDDCP
jgi:hypothetical protein